MFNTTWNLKVVFAIVLAAALANTTEAQTAPKAITAKLTDYVEMPLTARDSRSQPARINFLVEEPGHNRVFVSDSSGPLYILDKKTHQSTVYLDFNGSASGKGLFPRFIADFSFASGLWDSPSIPTTRAMASFTPFIWKMWRPRHLRA